MDKKEQSTLPNELQNELGDPGTEGFWHAVDFVHDCPHVLGVSIGVAAALRKLYPSPGCKDCSDKRESWYCLACGAVGCGRYINGCAQRHFKESSARSQQAHPLFLSSVDLSVWCYLCDNYVQHDLLLPVINELHEAKHGKSHPQYHGEISFIDDDP